MPPPAPSTRVPWWASLRWRIALAVAVSSLLVASTVATVIAAQAAQDAQESLRDQTLGRLLTAAEGYRVDGRLRFGATIDTTTVPDALIDDLATAERRSYLDDEYMWASERIGEGIILTVRVPASTLHDQDLERVGNLGTAAAVGVGVSCVFGYLSGTAMSRRLRRAAAGAVAIAEGDRDARVHEGGHDEIATLTRAVDTMADTLSHRLAVEQAFTSDVAHELRTPLTGLVSASELLAGDDEAAALVRRQVSRLRVLVEDLLEVSRLDQGSEAADLTSADLATATARVVREHDAIARRTPVELVVDRSHAVLIDARRFERVLSNLLVNADRHGGGDTTVSVDGASVIVQDTGPGFPHEIVTTGPQRFHASGRGKGSGLGLTIAVKQSEVMGAQLAFDNPETGGARATLTLPPAQQQPAGVAQRGTS